MNRILQNQHGIRGGLVLLTGLCLCLYFFYHLLQGERSLGRLIDLRSDLAERSALHSVYVENLMTIERKVAMMRPATLDHDLLEERVRHVLGYRHGDEVVVMRH